MYINYLFIIAPLSSMGPLRSPCLSVPPPLRASTTGVPSPSVCCYFFRNPPARPNRRPRRPFTRGRRGRVLQSEIDDASTVVCRALSIRSDDGICRGQAIHAGDWSLKSSGARHFPPHIIPSSNPCRTLARCSIPSFQSICSDAAWPERGGGSGRLAPGSCSAGEEGCSCS
jgi:hypothetical protein